MAVAEKEARRAYTESWLWALDPKNAPRLRDFLSMFKIEAADGTLKRFNLNVIQEQIDAVIERLENEGKPVRIIILKPRQVGCSTLFGGRVLERVVREEGQKCLIMADNAPNTEELYQSKIRELWRQIPAAARPVRERATRRELVVRHGERTIDKKLPFGKRKRGRSFVQLLTAGGREPARSRTLQHLFFSEPAFYENAKRVLTAALKSVHYFPGTSVVFESTANGASGEFYERWNAAVAGKSEYVPLFFPWFAFPEYTRPFESEAEKRKFISEMDEEEKALRTQYGISYEQIHWRRRSLWDDFNGDVVRFQQELPATPEEAFIASGRCRFSMQALRRLEKRAPRPIARGRILPRSGKGYVFRTDAGRAEVVLYRKPEKGREYIIGADVASGTEADKPYNAVSDFSAAVVRDRRSRRLMARVHLRCEIRDYARILYRLGRFFNDSLLVVERNMYGIPLLQHLRRMRYPRLYWEQSMEKVQRPMGDRYGFLTTKDSREAALTHLAGEIALERHELSLEQIAECRLFVRKDNGKFEASEGAHDDEVMADAILAAVNFQIQFEEHPATIEEKDSGIDPMVKRIDAYVAERLMHSRMGSADVDPMMGSEW